VSATNDISYHGGAPGPGAIGIETKPADQGDDDLQLIRTRLRGDTNSRRNKL
jgi:hypothetical protein